MRKFQLLLLMTAFQINFSTAQVDSTLFKRVPTNPNSPTLNMDASSNRPFLQYKKLPLTMGGYIEMNFQHTALNHVSNGSQFQFRRLSLFTASSISSRIKFMSEIEFENDPVEEAEGKPMEIEIEYAALDFEFHPLLNLRSGIILNPIGAFNQNHDAPKWEFNERPMAMSQLLPATFSNTGIGLYGKKNSKNWMFGYEVYLSGGFDSSIISNDRNRTYLPESKETPARLVSMTNGQPLLTTKLSLRHDKIGELGLSYMGGIYNQWRSNGIITDQKRRVNIIAVDFNTTIPHLKTKINTEWAWVNIQLPENYNADYGKNQTGGYIDVVHPIVKRKMLGWENALLNLGVRAEYANWHSNPYNGIHDDAWSFVTACSFRPNGQTVIRLNYRIVNSRDHSMTDLNRERTFSLGISTYF